MKFFTQARNEEGSPLVIDKRGSPFYTYHVQSYDNEGMLMRKFVSIVCLVIFLGVATPVQAQFRDAPTTQQASAKLYDTGSNPLFNKLFSPEHFRMSHSLEFSTGSFGGNGSSLGMYTNTMMWQFSSKLAARADVALAYSPDAGNGGLNHNAFGNNGGRIFLRNAELAYRPNERTRIHLSFRQSPYGSYASPYGYSPYGYGGSRFQASFGHADDLFWRDSR